jgi:hypothetical protein
MWPNTGPCAKCAQPLDRSGKYCLACCKSIRASGCKAARSAYQARRRAAGATRTVEQRNRRRENANSRRAKQRAAGVKYWVPKNDTPERKARRALNNRFNRWLRRYGVTKEEFIGMFQNQEGLCAVCARLLCFACPERCVSGACIDHDHGTGKVRGILCASCNEGIGKLRDSAQLAKNASIYLGATA